jgi:hypothetical protein
MFFLQQNQRTRAWNRFCPEAEGERELAQIMYTNVIKCKNDERKEKKRKERKKEKRKRQEERKKKKERKRKRKKEKRKKEWALIHMV